MAESTYDEQFEIDPPINNTVDPPTKKHSMSGVSKAISTGVVGMDTGFGQSSYDKEINYFADIDQLDPRASLQEMRSQKQGAWATSALALPRIVSKAATEIAKTPGIIGGLAVGTAGQVADAVTGEDKTDFIETAFNNPWIQTADSLNQYVNTELLPVYVSKAVEDGNLFDKLSSSEFWATDGADGIGFAIGAMFPGEFLGGLGLGAKLIGQINKIDKAADLWKAAERAEKLVTGLNKTGVLTPKGINTALAVGYNTLSEAGAGAKGIGDSLEQQKPQILEQYRTTYGKSPQFQLDKTNLYNDLKFQFENGQISEEEFVQLSNDDTLNNELLERKFKDQKSKAQANVFSSNLAILLGPNLLMHNRLFGKMSKGTEAIVEQGGKSLSKTLGKVGKSILENTASEGFFEEGLQTTMEQLYTGRAKKGDLTKNILDTDFGEIASEYLNTLTTSQGQTAIALGGIIGSGMTGIQSAYTAKARREQENSILTKMSEASNNLNTIFNTSDVYQKNTDGSIAFDTTTGKPKVDTKKAAEHAKALALNDLQTKAFDKALTDGDTETVEAVKRQALVQLMLPAVMAGERGVETLKAQLEKYSKAEDIQGRESQLDSRGTFEDFSKGALELANNLVQEREKFEDFSEAMIDLSYIHPDFQNANYTKYREDFMNELGLRYVTSKAQLHFEQKKLAKLEKQRKESLKELGLEFMVLDDERMSSIEANHPLIKKVSDDIRDINKNVSKISKDIEQVWDGKSVRKSYEEYIEDNLEADEEFSEANLTKINKTLDDINNIDNIQDLNKYEKGLDKNHRKNPVVDKLIRGKRELFKQQQDDELRTQQEEVQFNSDIESEVNAEQGQEPPTETQPETTETEEEEESVSGTQEEEEIDEEIEEPVDDAAADFFEDTDEISDEFEDQDTESIEDTEEELTDVETLGSTKVVDIMHLPASVTYYDSFLAWQLTPEDKVGDKSPIVNFSTIPKAVFNPNQLAVYDKVAAILKKDKIEGEDLEYLYNYYPLMATIEVDGKKHVAPLEALTKNNSFGFNSRVKPLRMKVINAMIANGNSFNGITTKFVKQQGGELETDFIDKSVKGLQFLNNIKDSTAKIVSKLKRENRLYYVNKHGNTMNAFTLAASKVLSSRTKGRGEIYMMIPKNDGSKFPLKLNAARISEAKAEAIYQVLKELSIFSSEQQGTGRNVSKMNMDEFLNRLESEVKNIFKSEIELFEKLNVEPKVEDLLTLLIHVNSKNPKTKIERADANTSTWKFGTLADSSISEVTVDQFKDDSAKDKIKEFLGLKRHNILLKHPLFNLNNADYLAYLIDNEFLSTNVVEFDEKNPTSTATFQGKSSIYMDDNITIPKPQPKPAAKKTQKATEPTEDPNSAVAKFKAKMAATGKTPVDMGKAEDTEVVIQPIVVVKPEDIPEVEPIEINNHVLNLRNAKTKEDGDKAMMDAMKSSNLTEARHRAEFLVQNIYYEREVISHGIPLRFYKALADAIEKSLSSTTNKPKIDLTAINQAMQGYGEAVASAEAPYIKPIPFNDNNVVKGATVSRRADSEEQYHIGDEFKEVGTIKAIKRAADNSIAAVLINNSWYNERSFRDLFIGKPRVTGKVEETTVTVTPAETAPEVLTATGEIIKSFSDAWSVSKPGQRNTSKLDLINKLPYITTEAETYIKSLGVTKDLPSDFTNTMKDFGYESYKPNNTNC